MQGPFLTYQLAAPGGLGPFLEHLGPAFHAIWADLARWDELPAGAVAGLAAQVDQTYGAEDRGALEAQRNRLLGQLVHLQAIDRWKAPSE